MLVRWDPVSLLLLALTPPLQLLVIPAGPGSAVFLLGAVRPRTDTGNQTVFSKQGIINQSSITGQKKANLFIPSVDRGFL